MRLGGFRAAIWWPSCARAQLSLGACLAAGELAPWLGRARPQPSTGSSWPLSLSLSLLTARCSLARRLVPTRPKGQLPRAQHGRSSPARLGRRQRAAARSLAALLGSLERALPRRPRRANIGGRARAGGSSPARQARQARPAELARESSLRVAGCSESAAAVCGSRAKGGGRARRPVAPFVRRKCGRECRHTQSAAAHSHQSSELAARSSQCSLLTGSESLLGVTARRPETATDWPGAPRRASGECCAAGRVQWAPVTPFGRGAATPNICALFVRFKCNFRPFAAEAESFGPKRAEQRAGRAKQQRTCEVNLGQHTQSTAHSPPHSVPRLLCAIVLPRDKCAPLWLVSVEWATRFAWAAQLANFAPASFRASHCLQHS